METLRELIEYAEWFNEQRGGHNLNFDGLEGAYSDVEVEVRSLNGHALGLSSFHNKIYIDPNIVDKVGPYIFYFILLHELGHLKSLRKYGIDFHISVLSTKDYDEYFDAIVYEETLADRYAQYVFKQLNGFDYTGPIQDFEDKEFLEHYTKVIDSGFGVIQNDVNRYDMLIESVLK